MPSKNIWPKETAGYHLTTRVPIVKAGLSVGETLKHLNSNISKFESINYVYVLDDEDKLKNIVSIKELYTHAADRAIGEVGIQKSGIFFVHPEADQEKASKIALSKNIKAVPVLDKEGVFLGVVPSDTILRILHKEFQEDILHSVGVGKSESEYDDVMRVPLFSSFKNRAPWIFFGMVGGIVLAQIIGLFEATLKEDILLAAFLPLVVYSGNAVGLQVQTVFVRDLSTGPLLSFFKYAKKQISVSLMIAAAGSVAVLLMSMLLWNELEMGIVVAVSILFSIFAASIFSLVVPLVIKKLKRDPAVGSGPFVTIVQDTMSVVIYFAVASVIL